MKENIQKIYLKGKIPENLDSKRQDQALAKLFPDYSRSLITSWIKAGQVKIDGNILKPDDKIRTGQKVIISAEIENREYWQAQPIQLNIIYEDEDIIVIDKPAGLVVHPAAGTPDKTLVNALLYHAPELAGLPRAGIIHRLDKGTSGLLVIARNLKAHSKLVKELQQRKITREYEAVVNGVMTAGGTIDKPIGRHPRDRKRMAVIESGKPAITHYRVIKRFPAYTHIKVILETGRTHQIRVHMAHIHYPLVGDPVYGGKFKPPTDIKRQALHARRLVLLHPTTGKQMEWTSSLPHDIQELLQQLER